LIRILSPSAAVCIQQFATLNLTLVPNPNPNRKPTVITDPQLGHRYPQIVTD